MKLTRAEDGTSILLAGQATIAEAEAVASDFRGLLGEARVDLDLRGLSQVDVSFYQLLLALAHSLAKAGRSLRVLPLPKGHAVLETAALLGIDMGRLIGPETGNP